MSAREIAQQTVYPIGLLDNRHGMIKAVTVADLPHLNRPAQGREQFRATSYDEKAIIGITLFVPFNAVWICRPQRPQK